MSLFTRPKIPSPLQLAFQVPGKDPEPTVLPLSAAGAAWLKAQPEYRDLVRGKTVKVGAADMWLFGLPTQ